MFEFSFGNLTIASTNPILSFMGLLTLFTAIDIGSRFIAKIIKRQGFDFKDMLSDQVVALIFAVIGVALLAVR